MSNKTVALETKAGTTIRVDPEKVESVEFVKTGLIKDDYRVHMQSGNTHEVRSFGSVSSKLGKR